MPHFFILLLLSYLLGNGYIYYRSWELLSLLPAGMRWILSIVYICGACSIFCLFLGKNMVMPAAIAHGWYEIGTGWLAFTLYMVALLALADLLHLCHVCIPHRFVLSLFFTSILLSYGYYRYTHPDVNVLPLRIGKPVEGKKQIRVALVSDVHLGNGTTKSRLKRYTDLINEQHPDLILLAGDLIDNDITPVEANKMGEELSRWQAPLGIYMVPGNHEYFSGIRKCRRFVQEETPFVWLQDSTVSLPNGIQVVGRDDRANGKRLTLPQMMTKTDASRPIILLDHQPYHLEDAEDGGVDLQVSGHTHHGQIWPLSLLTDHLFEVSHGYKLKGKSHFYVSSGLSLWGPPFRIGTRSELVILDIQFN